MIWLVAFAELAASTKLAAFAELAAFTKLVAFTELAIVALVHSPLVFQVAAQKPVVDPMMDLEHISR